MYPSSHTIQIIIYVTFILVIYLFLFSMFSIYKTGEIAKRYHISKYPTLKLFRNGRLAKREYRSQRSKDAFVSFIKEQMKESIVMLQDKNALNNIDVSSTSQFLLNI